MEDSRAPKAEQAFQAKVDVTNAADAAQVAAALMRLADAVGGRGKVSYLEEGRRRELARMLVQLAGALDPSGAYYSTLPELYVACPACGGKLRLAEQMHCACGRAWAFGLRSMA